MSVHDLDSLTMIENGAFGEVKSLCQEFDIL
jgi:hypothetical protein